MTSSHPTHSIEEKLRAATRMPQPRPEFLVELRSRLANEAILLEDAPLRRPTSFVEGLRLAFFRPAWLLATIVLLLLASITIVAGPQRVLAAVRGWLGYLPEIGFVQTETTLRLLAAPVVQERQGITVTVEQVVADAKRTVIVYTVEGLGPQHRPGAEDAPRCVRAPLLRLPEGQELILSGGSGTGWPAGYRSRAVFPAIPDKDNQLTLVIPCLDDTRPGAAPENWSLELLLQPAPPDFQPLPVVELPTQSPAPAEQAPADAPAAGLTPQPAPTDPHGIRFRLEKMVELADGFLFQGTLSWQGTVFEYPGFDSYQLQVTDASGQPVPVEPVEPDEAGDPDSEKQLRWAVHTNAKDYASPLTITLPSLQIDQPVNETFDLDLGANPQSGQIWELNQDLEVASRRVHLSTATFTQKPDGNYWLEFTFQTDPQEVADLSVWDPDNRSAGFTSSGGTDGSGVIRQSFSYDYLPTGVRHIQIARLSYPLSGPWVVTLDLPAGSLATNNPTPSPQVCLTLDGWQQLQAEPAASPPQGLHGRLLLETYTGQMMPLMSLAELDGSERKEIGIGGWGALAPDGSTVAFIQSDGPSLFLADTRTGEIRPVPGTTPDDYHPRWSPDGNRIAFDRSNDGIYITRLDGSALMKVGGTTPYTFLSDWMPDGKRLVVITQGAEGALVQTIEVETSAVTDHFVIDNRKGGFAAISPDGERLAFSEVVFGYPAYGVFVANLDGSEKRLIANLGAISVTASAWSPDGEWLLLSARETGLDGMQVTNLLVQPESCQVVRLDGLDGAVVAWGKE